MAAASRARVQVSEYNPQFTQEDRDLLRDTSSDVKRVLLGMSEHYEDDTTRFASIEARLKLLETWLIRVGAICATVVAIGGFLIRQLWR